MTDQSQRVSNPSVVHGKACADIWDKAGVSRIRAVTQAFDELDALTQAQAATIAERDAEIERLNDLAYGLRHNSDNLLRAGQELVKQRDTAQSALAAADAAMEAAGYVRVPKEATREMVKAGDEVAFWAPRAFSKIYRAMISARPTTPPAKEEK